MSSVDCASTKRMPALVNTRSQSGPPDRGSLRRPKKLHAKDTATSRQKLIKCRYQGIDHIGSYRIEDRFLILIYAYGTCRVTRGLTDERQLATRLLRNLIERAHRTAMDHSH